MIFLDAPVLAEPRVGNDTADKGEQVARHVERVVHNGRVIFGEMKFLLQEEDEYRFSKKIRMCTLCTLIRGNSPISLSSDSHCIMLEGTYFVTSRTRTARRARSQ